ncbi:MAG: transporter [bacterium]
MLMKKMFYFVFLSFILPVFLHSPFTSAEFQYPFRSISPDVTPHGIQQLRFGVEYARGERFFFQTADKKREVYQLPSLDLAVGITPKVEFLFSYPFLFLRQKDQESNYGSGDLRIATVFNLITEGKILPEGGAKFGVKLPNADDIREFGTDQTDFFIGGVFLKRIGKVKLLMNPDLAILGNPSTTETKQDDILIYTIGAIYPMGDNIAAGLEFHGIEFSRFGNDRRFLRGGLAYNWNGMLIDIGGAIGLTETSGDFQVGIGITLKYGIEKKEMTCPQ